MTAKLAPVVLTARKGAVAWITLNRPQAMNAINDEMRKGAWDIHARVADMDLAGIDASLCFPSLIAGSLGSRACAATVDAVEPDSGLTAVDLRRARAVD